MGRERRYRLVAKECYEWAMQYEPAKNYLSKLNSRRQEAAMRLWQYCEYTKKNMLYQGRNFDPVCLLELKSSFDSLEAEQLIDRFAAASEEEAGVPDSTRLQVIAVVRGFYHKNYRVLQPEAGKFEYAPKKTQGFPSIADRYLLYKYCYNPRDRFLILASTCTAIARETMSVWRRSHFERDWLKQEVPHVSFPAECLKGHGKGKYKGVRQETFLTPEAKRVYIEYLEWFSKTFNYRWKDSDHVFLCIKDNIGEPMALQSISEAIVEISERAGVKFGVHDGRRIVQTAMENVDCNVNMIQKIKGRKVRGEQSPYSKHAIDDLRRKYREALPELEFLAESGKLQANCEVERLQRENADLLVEKRSQQVFIADLAKQLSMVQAKQREFDVFVDLMKKNKKP